MVFASLPAGASGESRHPSTGSASTALLYQLNLYIDPTLAVAELRLRVWQVIVEDSSGCGPPKDNLICDFLTTVLWFYIYKERCDSAGYRTPLLRQNKLIRVLVDQTRARLNVWILWPTFLFSLWVEVPPSTMFY